ncbi:helix-turn-helix domain-containing protein [Nocardioides sp. SLBN-35]|uniref:helix-turn-helix domain-containing protein n=1 Tax=Nocardioides sp. SLBN-35 TaxID=2768445 RepID=UPI00114F3843|nr:helix-turn-helix domain-containing protein [Nocardioides sp. SLBN-35]TQK71494.1 AraC family transcriptional regulator [Nocardioides sp. SLBN-35]
MRAVPEARVFEVGGVAEVGAWERHNAEALIELACALPDGAFRAREVNLQLDRVHVALVSGTAHTVSRDAGLVAERPADAIAVYAALRGEALLESGGRRRVVRPGQLLVCDVDRPFLRGFGHGLEELAVKIPRPLFTEVTGLASLDAPLVIDAAGDGADPLARALVRLVGRSVAADVPVPADERAVLELVSVLATGSRGSLALAHRAAARAYIDDHLTDPALSAASVAAGAGISERQLSRVFADAGTSVPRQILARRLDLAHALLAAGAAGRTVDVATRCGFASASYFSQAFRRRYGVSAGEVRRSAAS